MNEKLHFIFSRRSVRKYRPDPVPDELVKSLLEAAMAAPSAVAKDPWRFIVIRSRETLDEMVRRLPNAPMLKQAPMALLVCGDIESAHGNLESYMLQDCSAAIENILLSANALGLGACWLGVHPRPERIAAMKELFGLPQNIVPVSGVALGYPADVPAPRTRYNAEYIRNERW